MKNKPHTDMKHTAHEIAYYAVRGTNDIQDVRNVEEWIKDLISKERNKCLKEVKFAVVNWLNKNGKENILDVFDEVNRKITL